MPPETGSRSEIAWKIEGGNVIVSFPQGHEVFPQGKTVTFKALLRPI